MFCSFFVVKNLPFTDISAQPYFFGYDIDITNKESFKEVTIMRHVYIRGIVGFIWLAAAVISGVSGNFEMSILYVILGGGFLYSSYDIWKKEKDNKGGK